jgi:hypothetical protein
MKTYLKEMGGRWCVLDSFGSGCCEHGNELMDSIKGVPEQLLASKGLWSVYGNVNRSVCRFLSLIAVRGVTVRLNWSLAGHD